MVELDRVKNYISTLCTNPLGDPPHTQYPNKVKKNIVRNMLCIAWMVIVSGRDIKEKNLLTLYSWVVQGEKPHKPFVHHSMHTFKPLSVETLISRLSHRP